MSYPCGSCFIFTRFDWILSSIGYRRHLVNFLWATYSFSILLLCLVTLLLLPSFSSTNEIIITIVEIFIMIMKQLMHKERQNAKFWTDVLFYYVLIFNDVSDSSCCFSTSPKTFTNQSMYCAASTNVATDDSFGPTIPSLLLTIPLK